MIATPPNLTARNAVREFNKRLLLTLKKRIVKIRDAIIPSVNRRSYLQTFGTIVGAPSLSLCSGLKDQYSTVVNVANEGADTTGGEPVDSILQDNASDDTLLWFPPGKYRVDRVWFEGLTHFGLAGLNATLVLGRPGQNVFLGFRQVKDVTVERLTVDSTAKNTAAWLDFRCVGGNNTIRDYRVRGFGDVAKRTNGFTLKVEGANTSLTVERAKLPDGAKNGAATFVFPRKSFTDSSRKPGTLTFRDCVMKGWGKEGLYASAHSGPLNVIGGEYANNAIDQIRIGGGNASSRAIVRNARVRIDNVPKYTPEKNRTYRGIWLEEGDRAKVTGCDIAVDSLKNGAVQSGITVNNQFGRATISDCRLQIGSQSPAILIKEPIDTLDNDDIRVPSLEQLPPEWTVHCRNVDIEGEKPGTEAILLSGRSGCRFKGVSVQQRGDASDGIRLVDADKSIIKGGSVVASRFPVLVDMPGNPNNGCRLAINNVSRLEGRDLDDYGERLVEINKVLGPFDIPVISDPDYCLSDALVAQLLQQKRQVVAVTRASDDGLYGRVVPFQLLESNKLKSNKQVSETDSGDSQNSVDEDQRENGISIR